MLCQEGYTSSLAAAALQELGIHRATDVIGGYAAWRAWQASAEQTSTEQTSAEQTSRSRPPRTKVRSG